MKPIEIITLLIALYGAFLSTMNYRTEARSKRWRLLVTSAIGEEGKSPMITFTAINIGERPVTLAEFSICYPSPIQDEHISFFRRFLSRLTFQRIHVPTIGIYSESFLSRRDHKFPYELQPGKSFEILLHANLVMADLLSRKDDQFMQFTCSFEDQARNRYYGQILVIDRVKRKIDFA